MRFKPVPVQLQRQKVKYQTYDHGALELAFNAVKTQHISANRAALTYGVPVSTLKDRVTGRVQLNCVPGQSPLFKTSEECQLVDHAKYMSSIGYGYSRTDMRHLATDLAIYLRKRENTSLLTDRWVTNLLKRWPTLNLNKARSLEYARAKSASEDVINNYYTELEKTLTDNNLLDKPHLIYNIDETGIATEHTPTRVLAQKSSKPQSVVSPRSGTTTIISCGNAAGVAIPPFFIFKGKRMNEELMKGKSPGTTGVMSDSGWSNSVIFKKYLEDHFLTYAQRPLAADQKLLILYDGHTSHVCKPVIDWARDNGIVLFVLPPHCSHILQPLDIGCFSPLKEKLNQECQQYMRENIGKRVTRYQLCELGCRAYAKGLSSSNLVAEFKKAGISPLDRNVIKPAQLAPSTVLIAAPATSTSPVSDESPHTNSQSPHQALPSRPSVTHSTSSDPLQTTANFLSERQPVPPTQPPKVNRMLHYGGKAITADTFYDKIKENTAPPSNGTKKGKVPIAGVSKSRKSTVKTTPSYILPQPVAGPSTINLIQSSDSSDMDTCDDDDTSFCCVCRRFQPDELHMIYHVEFVKWGQCDKCLHWVHLKFCTHVRALRRDSTFLCPCCQ